MTKRRINFAGPSIEELGIEIEKEFGNAEYGNSKSGITNIGNAKNKKATPKPARIKQGVNKDGNTDIAITENELPKRVYSTVQFKMIRDYLYTVLGDADSVEIKLSEMQKELEINPKTLYKHLKTLRETEFIITKLQYGTEIKRR